MRRNNRESSFADEAKRLRRNLISAIVVALLTTFATAGPANAIPGLQLVTASSGSNSSAKSVTAVCPPGKQVVGAAADLVNPAPGQVVLDDITPNAALTSVLATAFEDATGTGVNWSVRAHAICAFAPSGLVRVSATSATNSSSAKSAPATCPAGKRLFGTGAQLNGGVGRVVIDDDTPNSTLTTNTATGAEAPLAGGQPGNWSVTSYGICAFPPFGLHRAVSTGSSTSSNKTLSASCSSGFRVHGVGGDITGGGGAVSMEDLTPNLGLTFATVFGVEGGTAPTANWFLRTYAICAQ